MSLNMNSGEKAAGYAFIPTKHRRKLAHAVVVMVSVALALLSVVVGAPRAAANSVTVYCLGSDGTVFTCPATKIASDADIPGGTLTGGWYYVTGSVSLSHTLVISDAVYIILGNGASLDVTPSTGQPGILVPQGSILAITIEYPVTSVGVVTVSGDTGNAGIGGALDDVAGSVWSVRGVINATGGDGAAGIGAGLCTSSALDCASSQGDIKIEGGTVTATGGAGGAGIGGGGGSAVGQVSINSGTVQAFGGSGAAGIGNGLCDTGSTCLGSADKITIDGGHVSAVGGDGGAGIGGGKRAGVPAIEINGGTVNASVSAGGGAGIGGGVQGQAGPGISVTGGTVTATGGSDGGSGVGSGDVGEPIDITIAGGSVTATGGGVAAGIGGGTESGSGVITMTGGQVNATGGSDAPGVGPGMSGTPNNIIMSGGTLVAIAGAGASPALVGTFTAPSIYVYWDNTTTADPGGPGTAVPPDSGFVNSDTYQFVKIVSHYGLTVRSTTGGHITLDASGAYPEGTVVDIAAAADKGYEFAGWVTSDGGGFGDQYSLATTFTTPDNATTVTANFESIGGGGGGGVDTGGSVVSQIPLWAGAIILLAGVGLLARRRWMFR